jgi:hypothetical protein
MQCSLSRALEACGERLVTVRGQERQCRDPAGVSLRVRRILGDRAIIGRERGPQGVLFLPLVEQEQRLQELLVGLRTAGISWACVLGVAAQQLQLERTDDLLRDLILYREYVLQPAVEALRPHVRAVGSTDELRRDAHTVARLPHASLEDVVDVHLARDARYLHVLALVGERRGSRDHAQPRHVGQQVEKFLAQTVGEILILSVVAHVEKGSTTIETAESTRPPGCDERTDAELTDVFAADAWVAFVRPKRSHSSRPIATASSATISKLILRLLRAVNASPGPTSCARFTPSGVSS